MQAVRELLLEAKRPVVHIGQGVRIAKAIPDLFQFLESAKIPVLTARNGADIIPSDHSFYCGRPGTFAQRGANFIVQTCDLYLAIGTRLSLAQTGYNAKDYARNAKVVMVDIDRAELDKGTVPIHLKIHADAKDFLTGLNQYADWPDWSAWLTHCKQLQAKYPPVNEDQRLQSKYVNSYALIERLSDLASPNDVIVTDMGFAFQNTHQTWKVKQGQRLMTNCGLAPMGWGLPAAIGAALGTGRRVICIVGDGGLMMNLQELATLAHHKPNVKLFVLNNGGYLTMKQSQSLAFNKYMGSDEETGLSFPNFEKIAAAHRLSYYRLERLNPIALLNLLQSPGPVFCEVMMDPNQEQIPKSVNRRLENGAIVQTPLEDSYPYLPKEEIEENLCVR